MANLALSMATARSRVTTGALTSARVTVSTLSTAHGSPASIVSCAPHPTWAHVSARRSRWRRRWPCTRDAWLRSWCRLAELGGEAACRELYEEPGGAPVGALRGARLRRRSVARSPSDLRCRPGLCPPSKRFAERSARLFQPALQMTHQHEEAERHRYPPDRFVWLRLTRPGRPRARLQAIAAPPGTCGASMRSPGAGEHPFYPIDCADSSRGSPTGARAGAHVEGGVAAAAAGTALQPAHPRRLVARGLLMTPREQAALWHGCRIGRASAPRIADGPRRARRAERIL